MHRKCEVSSKTGRKIHHLCDAAMNFPVAFRICILALALLPGSVLAAGLTCTRPLASSAAAEEKQDKLDELDEVVINGEKATGKAADLRPWIMRLVGQYTYDGYVDLCGKDNAADQRRVTGKSDCIGLGDLPSVVCDINVRWPAARGENGAQVFGGVSNLYPAIVVYSLQSRYQERNQTYYWSVLSLQVDSKGIAERASGYLVGNTLTSSEPCVGIPGACWKITRIKADPDSKDISMVIDVEIDSQRVLRQSFLLHRVSNRQKARDTTDRRRELPARIACISGERRHGGKRHCARAGARSGIPGATTQRADDNDAGGAMQPQQASPRIAQPAQERNRRSGMH